MDSIKDVPMVDEKTGEIENAQPIEALTFSFGNKSTKNLSAVRDFVRTRSFCNVFGSQDLLDESLPNLVASFKRFGWSQVSDAKQAKTGSWFVSFAAPTTTDGKF